MREQKQQLNKVPSTEVQPGQLEYGVTDTVSMPMVAPSTDGGAKLAAAFNIGTQVVGKVVAIEHNKKLKKQALFDTLDGNSAGQYWFDVSAKEADKLPLSKRNDFMRNKVHELMGHLRKSDISDAYLRSTLNAFSSETDKYENANDAEIKRQALIAAQDKLYEFASSSVSDDYLKSNFSSLASAAHMTKAQAGAYWVKAKVDNVRLQFEQGKISASEASAKVNSFYESMGKYGGNPKYVSNFSSALAYYNTKSASSDNTFAQGLININNSIKAFTGGTTSDATGAVAALSDMETQITNAMTTGTYNTSEANQLRKAVNTIRNLKNEYGYMGPVFKAAWENEDFDVLQDMVKGNNMVLIDGSMQKLEGATALNFVKMNVDTIDRNLDSIPVSTNDEQLNYQKHIEKLAKIRDKTGVQSKYLEDFEKRFGDVNYSIKSVDEAKRMYLTANVISEKNDSFYEAMNGKEMVQKLKMVVDDPKITDENKIALANNIKANHQRLRTFKVAKSFSTGLAFLEGGSGYKGWNNEWFDTRADVSVAQWALTKQTKYSLDTMTYDNFKDVMYDHTFSYTNRSIIGKEEKVYSTVEGNVAEVVKWGVALGSDALRGIVLPNQIGGFTKKTIEKAVTGLLMSNNLQLSEVKPVVNRDGSVMFYNIETGMYIDTLHAGKDGLSGTIRTYSKVEGN